MKLRVLHLIGDARPGGSNLLVKHWMQSCLGATVEARVLSLAETQPQLKRWQPDVIISHYPCSWGYLRALYALRQRYPIWIYEHHYCRGFVTHQVRCPARFYVMLRLAYGLAQRVIAVSEAQRRWMLDHQLVAAAKVAVIHPASPALELLQVPPRQPQGPWVVGAYGRFAWQKGFDQLLAAFARLDPHRFRLRLGGYGPQDHALQQLAVGHPHVDLCDRIDDVPAFLQTCDVIAIPSRWEPWGLVCLEAKMAGKPIVAAAVDGLVEQVQGCGLLVPSEQPQQWETAIASLPQQPLSAWSNAGRASTQAAWPQFLDQWSTLLKV